MSHQLARADIERRGYPLAVRPLAGADASRLASLFRAIGDPVRLRLLSLIACCPDGEICVCDLLANFEVSAPTISHHLKVLRTVGLIDSERRGTWVYYRANADFSGWLASILSPDAVLPAGSR